MANVAAFNGRALFSDGRLPDLSGYERHLTLDGGVTLAPGGGVRCVTGGGSKTYVSDDYIGVGASVSCFAKVTSLSSTPGRRAIAAISRGTSGVVRFLLSDASGHVAVEYGNPGSLQHFTTSVSVLDGAEHLVGMAIDVLAGTPTWRIWVDDVVVASGTPTSDLPSAGGTFAYGKGEGLTGSPAAANALVKDLRWFNDPVYASEAYLFDAPVTNLVLAAYNFDAGAGTLVADQTLRHNDLTLTANGQWVTGVDGTGIGPISTGSPAAQGVALDLGDFDRLSICGWVRVSAGGSAAPFLSIEDAAGTPIFQLFKGGANGLLFKAWGGATWPFLDGNYRFGADGVLSSSERRFIHVNVNPTGFQIQVWGPTGTVIDDFQNYTFGTPPTNLPILEDASILRVGGAVGAGGQVEWDDLRVIRNYLNPLALTQLRTSHVTQEPAGVVPVSKTVDTRWNTLSRVVKAQPVGYHVAQRATRAAATAWHAAARVTAAPSTAWGVLARADVAAATAWHTAARVSLVTGTMWNKLARLAQARSATWLVAAPVVKAVAVAWHVASDSGRVEKTLPVAWQTRRRVSRSAANRWQVHREDGPPHGSGGLVLTVPHRTVVLSIPHRTLEWSDQ